jgi:hypothetical protein
MKPGDVAVGVLVGAQEIKVTVMDFVAGGT